MSSGRYDFLSDLDTECARMPQRSQIRKTGVFRHEIRFVAKMKILKFSRSFVIQELAIFM